MPGSKPASKVPHHTARFGESVISGITIDPKDALKALQDIHCIGATAPRNIGEDNGGRIFTAPATVTAGQRPEIARFGFTSPRVKHRGVCLVHKKLS